MVDLSRYKALSALSEWEDNYNQGDVEAIARSIRRFGMNGALRVWGTSSVIAGNHTFKAIRLIREQGADEVLDGQFPPANILVEDGEWYIAFIDVSHLDPLEANLFAVADNQTARLAVVDEVKLAQLLTRAHDADPSAIIATALGGDEVQRLVNALQTDFHPIPMEEQSRLDQVGHYCETCKKRLYE